MSVPEEADALSKDIIDLLNRGTASIHPLRQHQSPPHDGRAARDGDGDDLS